MKSKASTYIADSLGGICRVEPSCNGEFALVMFAVPLRASIRMLTPIRSCRTEGCNIDILTSCAHGDLGQKDLLSSSGSLALICRFPRALPTFPERKGKHGQELSSLGNVEFRIITNNGRDFYRALRRFVWQLRSTYNILLHQTCWDYICR